MDKKLIEKLKTIDEFEHYQYFVYRTMTEIEEELEAQGYQPTEINQAMQEFGLFRWQSGTLKEIENNNIQPSKPQSKNPHSNNNEKKYSNITPEKIINALLNLTLGQKTFLLLAIVFINLLIADYFSMISSFYSYFMMFLLGSLFLLASSLFCGERIVVRLALFVFAFLVGTGVFICIEDMIEGEQYQKITDFKIDSCNLEYRKNNEKYLCLYANDPKVRKLINEEIGKIKILREEANTIKYMNLHYYARTSFITNLQVIKK